MKKLFTLVLCMMMLVGCSNYRELNEVGLIIAMGIDKPLNNNDGYRVTYQVINPSNISGDNSSGIPVSNYTIEAKSLVEAYTMASTIIPRENTVSHLGVIVISEAVARDGLDLIFDVLERGETVRTYMPVFIARGSTAESVLGVVEPIESNPTKSIISTSENNQKLYAISKVTPVHEVISALSSEGIDLLLTGIKLNKELASKNQTDNLQDIKPTVIEVSGLAIFNKDKLVNWLDGELARTAHLIQSETVLTSYPLLCDSTKYITLVSKKSKSTLQTILNPRPTLKITIDLTSEIGETNCNININDIKVLANLEEKLKMEVQSQVKETIQISQDSGSDVFGFGNKLSKENPQYWKKHKKEWNEIFTSAEIDVQVNASIIDSGLLTNPYEEK